MAIYSIYSVQLYSIGIILPLYTSHLAWMYLNTTHLFDTHSDRYCLYYISKNMEIMCFEKQVDWLS